MAVELDNSKAVQEWLNSIKSEKSRWQYQYRWAIWIEYSKTKGLPETGDLQLEDMKERRQSNDNSVKFFYDNEVPKFFMWLQTEYRGRSTNKPLSESSALTNTTAVRSFFAYHRYRLEIRKEALPSVGKIKRTYKDHAFDIYQLRSMFKQGNLKERTILACGKDLWFRAGDFVELKRNFMQLLIQREKEKAENEGRDIDILEFELITEKEKEPASCHMSRETIELLSEYLRTYSESPQSDKLFPMTQDALNDLLRRLARKAKITKTGKVRWHCLRKFGITLMHGKIQEPVMKFMTGKHVDESLRTYIQANKETWKAFKLIESQISLTKSNGNGGNAALAKQLDDLKKATFKQMVLLKLIEKITPKEQMEKALKELAEELGLPKVVAVMVDDSIETTVKLDTAIDALAEAYEKKDLERILKENGNNH